MPASPHLMDTKERYILSGSSLPSLFMLCIIVCKVWAMAVSGDGERMITGGSDSVINCWVDSTEADREAEAARQDELRLK